MSFQSIEVGDFPAVVTEEFFGRERPDDGAFADAFVPRIEELLGKKVEQIQLFNGGNTRKSLAFVYFEDLTIRAAEFDAKGNFGSWLVAIAEPFGGSTEHRVTHSGINGMSFSGWDDLAADPSAMAKKYAPNSHRRVELDDEKTAYFNYGTPATALPFDAARFEAAWKSLLRAREMTATAPDPGSLAQLEKNVGTPLPEDLKALYAATGGVEELLYGFDLLSPKQMVAEHTSWSAIYDDWTLDDLQSTQFAEPGIYPVYTTPRRLPFVDLVGGSYLAVDLGPAAGGTYGQVITGGRDVDSKRLIARSVTDFLEKAATYDGSEEHELFSVFGRLRF